MEEAFEPGPETINRLRFSPITFLFGFGFGAFVGVALALLATAINDNQPKPAAAPLALAEETAIPGAALTPTPESRPRTKTALDVRLGPDDGYGVIGLLSKGEAVDAVGRDASSDWLAIRFPPGSSGRGWVPVTALDGLKDVDKLAIALPTPLPRTVSIPPVLASTDVGSGEATGGGATPRSSPTPGGPTPTATPNAGPTDLYVVAVSLLPDGRVSVTIGNRGPGDVLGQSIFVTVRDLAGRSEQLSTALGNLRAGGTTSLVTSGFRVTQATDVQAIVDPFASLDDPNRANNTLQVHLAPAATPTPAPPTPSAPF